MTLIERERYESPIINLIKGITESFEGKGLTLKPPRNIRESKATLFMAAAIQQLEDCWLEASSIPPPIYLTFQPVLRSQYITQVEKNPPTLTSFVNVATIGAPNKETEFDELVEEWKSLLESIFRDVKIETRESIYEGCWGNAEFTDKVIKFTTTGQIEVGDAVLKTFRNGLRLVDCGFGFERLLYLSTKNPLEGINFPSTLEFKIFDYFRSLTLLIASGVEPTQKGQGYRVRLFSNLLTQEVIKSLKPNSPIIDPTFVEELINHVYNYFLAFQYPFEADLNNTISILIRELRRSLFSNAFMKSFGPETKLRRNMGTFNFYSPTLEEFLKQFDKKSAQTIRNNIPNIPWLTTI